MLEASDYILGPYEWIKTFTVDQVNAILEASEIVKFKSLLHNDDELAKKETYVSKDSDIVDGKSIRFKQCSTNRVEWFFMVGKEDIPISEGLLRNYVQPRTDT